MIGGEDHRNVPDERCPRMTDRGRLLQCRGLRFHGRWGDNLQKNILGRARTQITRKAPDHHHVGLSPCETGMVRLYQSLSVAHAIQSLGGLDPQRQAIGWLHLRPLRGRANLGLNFAVLLVHVLVIQVLHYLRGGHVHIRVCPHIAQYKCPLLAEAND